MCDSVVSLTVAAVLCLRCFCTVAQVSWTAPLARSALSSSPQQQLGSTEGTAAASASASSSTPCTCGWRRCSRTAWRVVGRMRAAASPAAPAAAWEASRDSSWQHSCTRATSCSRRRAAQVLQVVPYRQAPLLLLLGPLPAEAAGWACRPGSQTRGRRLLLLLAGSFRCRAAMQ